MRTLEDEIQAKLADPAASLKPMTLEGCVVRLADTISYIGRDLEDAITLKLLRREELPPEVGENLGRTNGAHRLQSGDRPDHPQLRQELCGYSPEVGGPSRSREDSPIWVDFLAAMDPGYRESRRPAEIVRDFLASMTDAFLRTSQDLFFPQPLRMGVG